MKEQEQQFTEEMKDYIVQLVNKSLTVFEKSKPSSNVGVQVGGFTLPVRVDDVQLFYIGSYLLPNIMNYLVNILPQFLYPYVVAYLQDLSEMREDPITINELYNFLIEYNHGNIFDDTQTEG